MVRVREMMHVLIVGCWAGHHWCSVLEEASCGHCVDVSVTTVSFTTYFKMISWRVHSDTAIRVISPIYKPLRIKGKIFDSKGILRIFWMKTHSSIFQLRWITMTTKKIYLISLYLIFCHAVEETESGSISNQAYLCFFWVKRKLNR